MAMPYTNELIQKLKTCPPIDLVEVINCLFPELTRKESEVLYWWAYGSSTNEIAKIIDVTNDTIKTYLKRCKVKLNQDSISDIRLIFHSRYNSLSLAINLQLSLPSRHYKL
ncbi:helix-turn-helix domain-containing protein [Shewanella vaxholmensis]